MWSLLGSVKAIIVNQYERRFRAMNKIDPKVVQWLYKQQSSEWTTTYYRYNFLNSN